MTEIWLRGGLILQYFKAEILEIPDIQMKKGIPIKNDLPWLLTSPANWFCYEIGMETMKFILEDLFQRVKILAASKT